MLTTVHPIDHQRNTMRLCELYCQESLNLLDAAMRKVNHCLTQLSDEQLWWRPFPDANSIGNLLLHMSGNLKQWAVIPFSGKPDLRDRASEFSRRDPIDRNELLTLVEQTIRDVQSQIQNLDDVQLLQPKVIQGFETTALAAISHTTSHFVGHTHQIILLTRLQLAENYQFEWTDETSRSKSNDIPI